MKRNTVVTLVATLLAVTVGAWAIDVEKPVLKGLTLQPDAIEETDVSVFELTITGPGLFGNDETSFEVAPSERIVDPDGAVFYKVLLPVPRFLPANKDVTIENRAKSSGGLYGPKKSEVVRFVPPIPTPTPTPEPTPTPQPAPPGFDLVGVDVDPIGIPEDETDSGGQ